MARLGIFSQEEQRLFNSPPAFNSIERKRYFTFPNGILERANKLGKPPNRVYFLLMYGYFKATTKFYQGKFQQKDIAYVAGRLNITIGTEQTEEYKRRTYRNHREVILTYTGCKKFDLRAEQLLTAQLTPMVRSHVRPKLMLQQACDILIKNKTEIPSYHRLSTIISREMKEHQEELNRTIHQRLTKECRAVLDTLLYNSKPTPFTMRVLLHNSLRDFPMALLLRKTRRRLDKYCSICLDRESQSVKNDLKSMVAGLLRVQTSTNRVNARKIYRFIGIAINTLLLIPEALSQQGVGFEYTKKMGAGIG